MSENATQREHRLNTEWQRAIDDALSREHEARIAEMKMALRVLEVLGYHLSHEILRLGWMKVVDAKLRRIEEESEA